MLGMDSSPKSVLVRRPDGPPSVDRQQRADAAVAQPQSASKRDAQIDTEQDVAKEEVANPEVRRDRPAEIPGQQHRTEHGSPWPRIKRGYREQQQADPLPETG